jgi:VWFA-related protein
MFAAVAYAQDDAIRVDTNLVSVPASVLDRSGKYISMLEQKDFRIFEDGVEQPVTFFETVDQPVTVLMLLERTGSRQFQLAQVVVAANAFVRQMRPDDKLIAMSFGYGTDTIIPETKIKDAPKGVKVGRYANDRNTLLYEAVATGLKRIAKTPGRKAIVVLSAGNDPEMFSSATYRSTIKDAEESEATIYTIKTADAVVPPAFIRDMTSYRDKLRRAETYMNDLAEKTGGRAFRVDQIQNLDATFADVAGELVRQYVLGYSPTKLGKNGERRKIKVQVTTPGAIVRARKEVVYKR